jgi:F-type H+-transporting ATPase subunit epsilon
MILEIVSPEATLFKGNVTSVTVPGVDGEFQMLTNHAPIVSILGKGMVKFEGEYLKIDKAHKNMFTEIGKTSFGLPIASGTIELKDNKLIILAD